MIFVLLLLHFEFRHVLIFNSIDVFAVSISDKVTESKFEIIL
jgi:hypothetical protein